MNPQRIQRKRTKGWRMPEGAVYVGRPTLWGNPWTLRDATTYRIPVVERRAWCVMKYHGELTHLGMLSDLSMWSENQYDRYAAMNLPTLADYARALLAGRDLACWCPLDQPCHADVLLAVANAERTP